MNIVVCKQNFKSSSRQLLSVTSKTSCLMCGPSQMAHCELVYKIKID